MKLLFKKISKGRKESRVSLLLLASLFLILPEKGVTMGSFSYRNLEEVPERLRPALKKYFEPKNSFQKPSKEHNIRAVVDGFHFASKAEAKYYERLKTLQQQPASSIKFFLRQIPFHLPGNVKYIADFLIFYSSGDLSVIDVKGHITKDFKRTKKIVEALYPIKIEIAQLIKGIWYHSKNEGG